jgi:hypothetical protein
VGFNRAHPAPAAANTDSSSATGAIQRPGADRDAEALSPDEIG